MSPNKLPSLQNFTFFWPGAKYKKEKEEELKGKERKKGRRGRKVNDEKGKKTLFNKPTQPQEIYSIQ